MSAIHFDPWPDEVHQEEKQQNAILRACKWDCAPVPGSLDRENKCCEFHGDHGDYYVTLKSCNCGAFRQLRGRAPCKHIYRLAAELGLVDIQVQDGRSRRDISEGIFSLAPAAQEFLYHHMGWSRLIVVRTIEMDAISQELLTHGFFTEQLSSYTEFIKQTPDAKKVLDESGLPGFDNIRNDIRAYCKVLEQLEHDNPALLREKLLCIEATEATINAVNTIKKRFEKKFIPVGMETVSLYGETYETGRVLYEDRFDNEVI